MTTYTVNDEGKAYFFDEIKIIKKDVGTLNVLDGNRSSKKTSVYPVPAHDYLNISPSALQQAEIYSMDGKLVESTASSRVNISAYPKGAYLLRIVLKDGTTETHKILVN